MPKVTNAFRWIYGTIIGRPIKFSWLIDRRLAGTDVPLAFSQYRWLLRQGVQSIVTVREKPLPAKWVDHDSRDKTSSNRAPTNYFHLKVKDKDVPSVERIR